MPAIDYKRGDLHPSGDGRVFYKYDNRRGRREVWANPEKLERVKVLNRASSKKLYHGNSEWRAKELKRCVKKNRERRHSNPTYKKNCESSSMAWYFRKREDPDFVATLRLKERNRAKERWWANPEESRAKARKIQKQIYARKSDDILTYHRRREAHKKSRVSPLNNRFFERAIYSCSRRVSKCLSIPHGVDHIIPLTKGGVHHHLNLQVIPKSWNSRKNNNEHYQLPFPYLMPKDVPMFLKKGMDYANTD